jgi:hypothetical protein
LRVLPLPVVIIHDQHVVGENIAEGQVFHVYAVDFTLFHRSDIYLQKSSPRLLKFIMLIPCYRLFQFTSHAKPIQTFEATADQELSARPGCIHLGAVQDPDY